MKKLAKIVCAVVFLSFLICSSAEATGANLIEIWDDTPDIIDFSAIKEKFRFLYQKKSVDIYAKYIGIDENTLSSEEQDKLNEIRENLYREGKIEFHFIDKKYPMLEVSNVLPSEYEEYVKEHEEDFVFAHDKIREYIEYVTKDYKKGDRILRTDSLSDFPPNSTDKWIEYKGENKGRNYYKLHNLNQTDFWEMDIPPTKEDTEEMVSYDPYKVVKYYPRIEQAYYDTPAFWEEEKINRTNEILNRNYPTVIDGYSIQYYKPQSMQKEQAERRATKKIEELFYKTRNYDKDSIDYSFESDIFNIRQQRTGYLYADQYGGEYWQKLPHTSKLQDNNYIGKSRDAQDHIDANSKKRYRILTEKDMASIDIIHNKKASFPVSFNQTQEKSIEIISTPTPTLTPAKKPVQIPFSTPYDIFNNFFDKVRKQSPQEDLINKSVLNETISVDLLNETAFANEKEFGNTTSVDNKTFANLTETIDTTSQPDEISEVVKDVIEEEIVEVIPEEPEVAEVEPEVLPEPKDNTPFGIAKQKALSRPVVAGDWERKIIKSKGTLVLLWENSKQRKTKIRFLTSEMAERLTDYELGTFSDPMRTREGDITAWTHKKGDKGIDTYKQEEYFSEEGKRFYEDIAVSCNFDPETRKIQQIFISLSDSNIIKINFDTKKISFKNTE
ncbi:MAG: hypothetical protein KAS87_00485 [Candidatus Omnitrophica bacterium]|nr:hypothetical protein [Candidatus Omnitrophota bacterium]